MPARMPSIGTQAPRAGLAIHAHVAAGCNVRTAHVCTRGNHQRNSQRSYPIFQQGQALPGCGRGGTGLNRPPSQIAPQGWCRTGGSAGPLLGEGHRGHGRRARGGDCGGKWVIAKRPYRPPDCGQSRTQAGAEMTGRWKVHGASRRLWCLLAGSKHV